ncbi:cell wall hydrolase [Sphingobium estronivorans]|uniref:cell wall hydrolase n=1 Tax=Sphingobium estronivorans TaxID=1577690 RepID=UPI001F07354D|nr:cell wall hydrolase [Sphingobium estronivorans]
MGARQGAVVAAALVAVVAPRCITAAPLDLLAASETADDPAEKSGENWPGSAFFFARDAFDPVPGALRSEHVLGLDRVQAAPATAFRGLTALDSYRALHCLTSAIYYEAGSEPEDGQRAVAQVVLNRVRHPAWPKSICGVIYQGSERTDSRCQFTFSCDGSMTRLASIEGWVRARRIASQALAGLVYRPVGLATYYHSLAVRPDWAATMRPVAVIGAHIFYRPPGIEGTPAAFRISYPGRETQSGPSRPIWSIKPLPLDPIPAPTAPLPAPAPASRPPAPEAGLPQSDIRPEYRTSGRPLI